MTISIKLWVYITKNLNEEILYGLLIKFEISFMEQKIKYPVWLAF
jgi:hypothetical protein